MVDAILEEYLQSQEAAFKLTLEDIIASGQDKEEWPSWYPCTLREKPHILCETVKNHLASHSRLQTPHGVSKLCHFMTMAVFEVILDKQYILAIWKCINRLLGLLEGSSMGRYCQDRLIEELYCLCNCVFKRTHEKLKRHMSAGVISEWVLPKQDDEGNTRDCIKKEVGEFVLNDLRPDYLFCFFSPAFDMFTGDKFIRTFYDTSKELPLEIDRPLQTELYAVCELNIIVGFVKKVLSLFPPAPSFLDGDCIYRSTMEDLEAKLARVRSGLERYGLAGSLAPFSRPDSNTIKSLTEFDTGSGYDATLHPSMAGTPLVEPYIEEAGNSPFSC
jgi:hypothetical protein